MRSSLETDDHLSDALLLYMKGMGLVKRAVELGRSILEQIHAMRPLKSTEPDIASLANNARVLSGRTNELLSWLSAQYALLLDRAEKCREQRISLTSSSQASGNNSGNGTNNISPSGGGGGGGGSMNASDGGRGGLAGRVQLRIYGAALQLARAAAVKEVLGNHALSLRMYRHGQLLIESLLLEPNITPNDHSILTGYDHGFQDRIAHLKKVISDPDTFDHDDILGNVKLPETSDSNDVSNENPETNSDENTSESAGLDIPSLKGLPRIISDDKALSSLQIAPPMKMLQPRSLRDHAGPASPPRLTRPSDNPFGLDLGAEDEGAAFA
jgi:hypothetical protein